MRPDATSRSRSAVPVAMPDREAPARGFRRAPAADPRMRAPIDVIVELDDRMPVGRAAGKLERYDHFLAGWSVHTARYGRRTEALAVVVFVCRDRARARECARLADPLLTACRAYAGEYPFDWEYPGRERILFAAERDVHDGSCAPTASNACRRPCAWPRRTAILAPARRRPRRARSSSRGP